MELRKKIKTVKKTVIAVVIVIVFFVLGLALDIISESKFAENIKEWQGRRIDEIVERYEVSYDSYPKARLCVFRRNRFFSPLWRMLASDDYVVVSALEEDGVVKIVWFVCRFPSGTFLYPKM